MTPVLYRDYFGLFFRSNCNRWSVCADALLAIFGEMKNPTRDFVKNIQFELSDTPSPGFIPFQLRRIPGNIGRGIEGLGVAEVNGDDRVLIDRTFSAVCELVGVDETETSKPHYVKLHVNPEGKAQ